MQNEVKAYPGQTCLASRFCMTKTWLALINMKII
jgi:hypothetical protein